MDVQFIVRAKADLNNWRKGIYCAHIIGVVNELLKMNA